MTLYQGRAMRPTLHPITLCAAVSIALTFLAWLAPCAAV